MFGIKLTNPNKIVFEQENITKRDVANYYELISDLILPYIKNRPLSLVRCPSGVAGDCHYRKNADRKTNKEENEVIMVKNINDLLHEIQMNTIEFHIYGSTVARREVPDIMVLDLDPDEGVSLAKIRQGAKDLRNILEEVGLTSFVKTSGGSGYHIVIPFGNVAGWEVFSNFANQIAKLMETKWPARYTTNIRKDARKGKIFVDWLRNTRGATSVAPYSLRAKIGAAVSAPIAWDELGKITPNGITIKNIAKQLQKPNPWEDFFDIMKKQQLV